jgi:hypothetical protein
MLGQVSAVRSATGGAPACHPRREVRTMMASRKKLDVPSVTDRTRVTRFRSFLHLPPSLLNIASCEKLSCVRTIFE